MNNTKMYLCNVPLDSDYNHTFYFGSASNQLDYFTTIAFKTFDDFSYQRKDNIIRVNALADSIIHCNYVVYQNTKYSTKWYYAFVKEIRYINDSVTELLIQTDVMQTWMFNYTLGQCFVEREHVSDDTTGLHTIPEPLEVGEYISTNSQPIINFRFDKDNCCIVVALTEIDGGLATLHHTINYEIPSGLYYVACTTELGLKDLIKYYDEKGKGDAVSYVFLAPKEFFTSWLFLNDNGNEWNGQFAVAINFEIEKEVSLASFEHLGKGYIPKNKKLLTYPYQYLQVSNHAGSCVNYKYEEFNLLDDESNDGRYKFKLNGTITPGCSMRAYPINYKNIKYNYDEGIAIGKLPIGSWNSDVYTNWITQNSLNLGVQTAGAVVSAVGSAFSGNPMGVVNSGLQIAGTMAQIHQMKMIPDQVKGNTNAGDVNYQFGLTGLAFKRMTIKNEYAEIIDKYFTMYGYKVNICKVPNKNHRSNHWYIKTIEANVTGSIPTSDRNIIINNYNKGITFWKNPAYFRNYDIDNTIV